MNVDLTSLGLPPEFVLFGEDASRVVISCDRENLRQNPTSGVKIWHRGRIDWRDGARAN